eukprot:NODE_1028_length_2540_cov_0.124539.p2 type:complete len:221 gc:universal NODE_1028_length_2540_cov_0.124539:1006-344(-)
MLFALFSVFGMIIHPVPETEEEKAKDIALLNMNNFMRDLSKVTDKIMRQKYFHLFGLRDGQVEKIGEIATNDPAWAPNMLYYLSKWIDENLTKLNVTSWNYDKHLRNTCNNVIFYFKNYGIQFTQNEVYTDLLSLWYSSLIPLNVGHLPEMLRFSAYSFFVNRPKSFEHQKFLISKILRILISHQDGKSFVARLPTPFNDIFATEYFNTKAVRSWYPVIW